MGTAAVATMGLSLMAARKREVDTIPIKAITSVTTSGRVSNSDLVIRVPGDVITARVSKGEAERINSTLLSLMYDNPAQVTPAAAPAQSVPDLTDQLTKLAALRDQGIVTQDEFEAMKAQLLNRM